jgi:hypothetical protein
MKEKNAFDNLVEELTERVVEGIAPALRAVVEQERKRSTKLCYSKEETARMLGVEVYTLDKYRRNKEIEFTRTSSRQVVFLPEHIQDFLDRRSTMSRAKLERMRSGTKPPPPAPQPQKQIVEPEPVTIGNVSQFQN